QVARVRIEDQGVSGEDALQERTRELRLFLKQLRKPNLVSSLVDQPRSRTVEQRNTGAPSFHDIDRTSQFVRLPYVILVAKSEVIAVETFCASHEKKVCRRPTPRTVDDFNLARFERFSKGTQDRFGTVRRAVIGCNQLPVLESLPFDRGQLFSQKTLTIERAQKKRDVRSLRRSRASSESPHDGFACPR